MNDSVQADCRNRPAASCRGAFFLLDPRGTDDSTRHRRAGVAGGLRGEIVGSGVYDNGSPDDGVVACELEDGVDLVVIRDTGGICGDVAEVAEVSVSIDRGAVPRVEGVVVTPGGGRAIGAVSVLMYMKAVSSGGESLYVRRHAHALGDRDKPHNPAHARPAHGAQHGRRGHRPRAPFLDGGEVPLLGTARQKDQEGHEHPGRVL